MKVRELIEELKNLNPDLTVVTSRDQYGEKYTEVTTIGFGDFVASEEGFFQFYYSPEDEESMYTKENANAVSLDGEIW